MPYPCFTTWAAPFFYSTLLTGNIAPHDSAQIPAFGNSSLLIGLPQFLPEITNKRIRLTLHLPVGCTAVVYTMVLYGLAVFCCCTLLPALLITVITLAVSFPAEVTVATLQTLLPWLLGGMTAYFFTAMIAFEAGVEIPLRLYPHRLLHPALFSTSATGWEMP